MVSVAEQNAQQVVWTHTHTHTHNEWMFAGDHVRETAIC
jgi:hypothetical protein